MAESGLAIEQARQWREELAKVDRKKQPEQAKAAQTAADAGKAAAQQKSGQVAEKITARVKELQDLSGKIAAEQRQAFARRTSAACRAGSRE